MPGGDPGAVGLVGEAPETPLYGVSTDVGMPPGRLQREAERLGVRYPVLHDVRAEVAGRYGIDVFPTTLVVRDGQIVQARVGTVTGEVLDQMVAAAQSLTGRGPRRYQSPL